MFPLRDSAPSGAFPVVTSSIIGINVAVWFYELSLGHQLNRFVYEFGLTPAKFIHFYQLPGGFISNALVPLFTSIFMHAGQETTQTMV